MGNKLWRIRAAIETDCTTGEPLYWSNQDGWTVREAATVFSDEERSTFRLAIGGVWEPEVA